jgi:hypothetical protein
MFYNGNMFGSVIEAALHKINVIQKRKKFAEKSLHKNNIVLAKIRR